jgi:hypothetical protein
MAAKIEERLHPRSSCIGTERTPVDQSGAELAKPCRKTIATMV